MGVLEGFIPEIWAGALKERLFKSHVFASICNRDYEGEIKGYGDTVRINEIGPITVSTYTPNSTSITYSNLTEAQTILTIDQDKYFAFQLEDVVNAQTKPKVMQGAMREAGYRLRDAADQYIAGLYGQAGQLVDSSGSAYSVTSVNIVEIIGLCAQKLNESNTPMEGRWMVIPPWFQQKMVLAKIALDTNNSEVISNGFVGRALGFNFLMSNNVSEGTPSSHANARILAGYEGSITFAEQILKVENVRLESSFRDGVRGQYVYGAKIIRPESLVRLLASYAVEP